MKKNKRVIIAGLFLIFLLSSCGGGNDMVGRWEMVLGKSGMVYEFYDDGTGASYFSLDPFDITPNFFTYNYDSKTGILAILTVGNPTERTINFQVTFKSQNEISLQEISANSRRMVIQGLVRKPLPKLPPGARARIGGMMLGKDFTLVDAEKLKPGWEEDYIALRGITPQSDENAAIWRVTLQIESDTKLYILREADGQTYGWEAISVITAPKNVSADVKREVEHQSPGAVILSAHRSEKTIEGDIPWCVVYRQETGPLTRMIMGETWLITDVSEIKFAELGCTNP